MGLTWHGCKTGTNSYSLYCLSIHVCSGITTITSRNPWYQVWTGRGRGTSLFSQKTFPFIARPHSYFCMSLSFTKPPPWDLKEISQDFTNWPLFSFDSHAGFLSAKLGRSMLSCTQNSAVSALTSSVVH